MSPLLPAATILLTAWVLPAAGLRVVSRLVGGPALGFARSLWILAVTLAVGIPLVASLAAWLGPPRAVAPGLVITFAAGWLAVGTIGPGSARRALTVWGVFVVLSLAVTPVLVLAASALASKLFF